ncbi:MAG: hypothetical protein WD315_03870 [Balneolaceae bacterium]
MSQTVPSLFSPVFFLSLFLSGLMLTGCETEERQRPVLQFDRSNPAVNGSRYPDLLSPDGETLYMSWVTRIEEGVSTVEYTRYRDGVWLDPRTLYVGTDLDLSWVNRPAMQLLRTEEPIVHWIRRLDTDPLSTEVHVAIPGISYGTRHSVHTGERMMVRQAPAIATLGENRLLAWWLERPATLDEESRSQGELRSAVINAEGEVLDIQPVHGSLQSCGAASLADSETGPIGVAWLQGEQGCRLSIVRYIESEGVWAEPVPIDTVQPAGEDRTPGVPVIHVWNGQLAIARIVENGEKSEIRVLQSGSETMVGANSIEIPVRHAADRLVMASAPDGSLYLVWMAPRGELADLYLTRIEDGEVRGEPVRLGATNAAEISGKPAVAAMRNGLAVAWTQTAPFYQVRTIHYPWPDDETTLIE